MIFSTKRRQKNPLNNFAASINLPIQKTQRIHPRLNHFRRDFVYFRGLRFRAHLRNRNDFIEVLQIDLAKILI